MNRLRTRGAFYGGTVTSDARERGRVIPIAINAPNRSAVLHHAAPRPRGDATGGGAGPVVVRQRGVRSRQSGRLPPRRAEGRRRVRAPAGGARAIHRRGRARPRRARTAARAARRRARRVRRDVAARLQRAAARRAVRRARRPRTSSPTGARRRGRLPRARRHADDLHAPAAVGVQSVPRRLGAPARRDHRRSSDAHRASSSR